MSGIAGMLRFDGRPVRKIDLERVAGALRQHGPDRSGLVSAGNIGLVHVLMRMTPEDRFDAQPFRGSSGAIIAADLRLDNRDELLGMIAVDSTAALGWSDSRLVLAAWEKHGDAIWPKMRGPFAVAIWEPRQRVLRLVRDHLGLNVVMWYRTGDFLAFATMPKGLFAFPDVPRELDEQKLADFLVLNHEDYASTMFRGVARILPGHLAVIDSAGAMQQRPYWSVADIEEVRMASDEDYAERLRWILERAVKRQMRSITPVGCYLTGGLDSSSVAVLTARVLAGRGERLAAFTQVPREGYDQEARPGRYVDETPFVEAIRRHAANIDVTYVRSHECDDLAEIDRFTIAFEFPVRNPTNLGWILSLQRIARSQGRRVLLGGAYGNYSISYSGWPQTVDHLLQGRIVKAYRQWKLFYDLSPYSRWRALKDLIVEPLLPLRISDWIDRRRNPLRTGPWQPYCAIRPGFAADHNVEARAGMLGHDFLYRLRPGEQKRDPWIVDYAGDWAAAEKATTGVETRDPTADIDVVSYCFGVPPEQYLVEGIDRSLIRRAMWRLLPPEVLTNRYSGMQSADWHEKIESKLPSLSAEIEELGASDLVKRAIDLPRLRRAVENWPKTGWHRREVNEEYHLAFTRGIATARFIRWVESSNRPAR